MGDSSEPFLTGCVPDLDLSSTIPLHFQSSDLEINPNCGTEIFREAVIGEPEQNFRSLAYFFPLILLFLYSSFSLEMIFFAKLCVILIILAHHRKFHTLTTVNSIFRYVKLYCFLNCIRF